MKKLDYLLWLLAVLTESQEVIDEIEESPLYKQSLKNSINGMKREIDKVFASDRCKEFYLNGGAEGLQQMSNDISDLREEYIKRMNSYA